MKSSVACASLTSRTFLAVVLQLKGCELEQQREQAAVSTSCKASSASAVHRKGSGATLFVISRHCAVQATSTSLFG